jgi:ribosome recycling factor
VLRLNIPPLTEERRKEMTKVAKGIGEEGKVAVRNIRREAVDKIKKMEKDKAISKDESANGQENIQKVTDKYTKVSHASSLSTYPSLDASSIG